MVIIAVVLSGIRLVKDVPYTGRREIDHVGALLSILGMGGIVLGILVWQEGGVPVLAILAVGAIALAGLAFWLTRQKRRGKPVLIDPGLFSSKHFRLGISQQMLQQIALGGMMIALPIYLQMVLEYNSMQAGLSIAPLSSQHVRGRDACRTQIGLPTAKQHRAHWLPPAQSRTGDSYSGRAKADSGWYLAGPLVVAGSGLGLLVSQLNNYTLAPISEERVSEAAGVNSASGSFGLSFGLAFTGAIMLATLAITFTAMAMDSTVLPPADQQRVAVAWRRTQR